MPDTSKYWREVDTMDLNYLYGNFIGESALDKRIKKAESEMKKAKKLEEERLIKIFDDENYRRLSAMPIKDMSFAEIELLNEIKKGHTNVGKAFDGSSLSDVPQAEGSVLDTTKLKAEIIHSANALIPMISSRGVGVQPIPEGADLQSILSFVTTFRDALKNSQQPASGIEEPDEPETVHKSAPKYTLEELKLTKIELNRMIAELER